MCSTFMRLALYIFQNSVKDKNLWVHPLQAWGCFSAHVAHTLRMVFLPFFVGIFTFISLFIFTFVPFKNVTLKIAESFV